MFAKKPHTHTHLKLKSFSTWNVRAFETQCRNFRWKTFTKTVEIPGYTLSWITMNRIGRRWSLAGSLLLCSFTCAAGGFVHHGNVYNTRLNLYIYMNLIRISTLFHLIISFSWFHWNYNTTNFTQKIHGLSFHCSCSVSLASHRHLPLHMCIQLKCYPP